MSHTKEPWYFENEGGNYRVMAADENGGYSLADMCCDDQEANARRIVACVNACAGMDDVNPIMRHGAVKETVAKQIVLTISLIKECDELQSQLKQVEALSEARLLQIGELKEQVECSNITEKNMEGRLNIATVKLAAMKEKRDELLAALEQFIDPEGNPPEDTGEWSEVLRVIASVKGGAK